VTDQLAADPALGDGEPVLATTTLAPLCAPVGSGLTWVWFLPLLFWWRLHERRRIRETAGGTLGIPLGPINLLVVTPTRLVLWSTRKVRKGHYHRDQLIGQINRSELASFTNNTVGKGWRTCRLTLHDGADVSVRIPARDIDRVLALLTPSDQA
jgi:hypothetical protein